ncbi:MAG TPA: type I phosphomannose isomerase catalytic subunit [Terriglobales bacterium]|nr:type I phosphomannose isomerase catalytic subunit [Terriglobales bacterium]
MSDLYPLLMMPEFHERVWGTRDLAPIYSRVVGNHPIGEAWLTGEQCRVANGPFSGITLAEMCQRFGRDLVGDTAPEAIRFPLLVKFLFPKEKLSVQVHPDDDGARAMGLPNGKTECWYVARSVAGAQVGLGLKQGTTREDFARAIEEKHAEDLMNWIDVKTGDMIYVDAGTVHAIAPGSILVEAQQNSDTTFRLYDYGRPRELHVEQGMRAVREKTAAGKVIRESHDGHDVLVASPYFVVERYELAEPKSFTETLGTSAQILVAVDGAGAVESPGAQPVSFNRGEAVIIPASLAEFTVRPQWTLEMLRMRVPAEKLPPPKTARP